MVLHVELPNPPDLSNRGLPEGFEPAEWGDSEHDFRRAELADFLADGAWTEAFNEWAEYTDLTESEFRTIDDQGLFTALDVFWDPVGERLRFERPALPSEWTNQKGLGSRTLAELTDLGQTVIDMLEDAYVDWGSNGAAEEVWSDETFGEELHPE